MYTLVDLAATNFIATASVLVRDGLMKPLPELAWKSPVGDWAFHAIHATRGDIGFLSDKTMVYRLHEGGVYHARRADPVAHMLLANTMGRLIADYVGTPRRNDFDRAVARRTVSIARAYLERGQLDEARAALAEVRLEWVPELRTEYRALRLRATAPELNDTYLRVVRDAGYARAALRRWLPQPVKRVVRRVLRMG